MLNLHVIDNDNDTLNYTINKDAPSGVSLTVTNNNNAMLSWLNVKDPGNDRGARIQVVVTDGKASASWFARIEMCKCKVRNTSDCFSYPCF